MLAVKRTALLAGLAVVTASRSPQRAAGDPCTLLPAVREPFAHVVSAQGLPARRVYALLARERRSPQPGGLRSWTRERFTSILDRAVPSIGDPRRTGMLLGVVQAAAEESDPQIGLWSALRLLDQPDGQAALISWFASTDAPVAPATATLLTVLAVQRRQANEQEAIALKRLFCGFARLRADSQAVRKRSGRDRNLDAWELGTGALQVNVLVALASTGNAQNARFVRSALAAEKGPSGDLLRRSYAVSMRSRVAQPPTAPAP